MESIARWVGLEKEPSKQIKSYQSRNNNFVNQCSSSLIDLYNFILFLWILLQILWVDLLWISQSSIAVIILESWWLTSVRKVSVWLDYVLFVSVSILKSILERKHLQSIKASESVMKVLRTNWKILSYLWRIVMKELPRLRMYLLRKRNN